MAKLDSGAMTIGNNDNWREIFDDQNATAQAANQATADLAPIINGKRCALSVASGGFVLLRNSTITGKADGAYTAAKAIPANTDLDESYLTAVSGGVANALNGKIATYEKTTVTAGAKYTVNRSKLLKFGNWVLMEVKVTANSAASNTDTLCTVPNGYKPNAQSDCFRNTFIRGTVEDTVNGYGGISTAGNVTQSYTGSVQQGDIFIMLAIYPYA